MDLPTNPTVQDLLDAISKLDPNALRDAYPQIVGALQARMLTNQEPFV